MNVLPNSNFLLVWHGLCVSKPREMSRSKGKDWPSLAGTGAGAGDWAPAMGNMTIMAHRSTTMETMEKDTLVTTISLVLLLLFFIFLVSSSSSLMAHHRRWSLTNGRGWERDGSYEGKGDTFLYSWMGERNGVSEQISELKRTKLGTASELHPHLQGTLPFGPKSIWHWMQPRMLRGNVGRLINLVLSLGQSDFSILCNNWCEYSELIVDPPWWP